MKIFSAIYNEMPWTPFFLEHLLEYDCPIHLSEGASDLIQFGNERSTDGTLEIMQDFASKHNHVNLVYHNLEDRKYGRLGPRLQRMIETWDSLEYGEWMLAISPDNYYLPEDIKKMKEVFNSEVPENTFQMVTGMKIFCFNFNTVITKRDIKGLTKGWISMFPCIYRKQNKYTLTHGNELLKDKEGKVIIARTIQNTKSWKNVIVREDIVNLHYRNVKRLYQREKRFGKKEAQYYANHSLEASYFEEYNGQHPKVLDNHPWRYTKDCRNDQ